MKKKLLIASSIATLIILGLILKTNFKSISEIDGLREKHAAYLNNSTVKESLKMTKAERLAQGLPPNKYNEQMFELTMDPSTGRPQPDRVFALQKTLKSQLNRVPGESSNSWEERGPDNVGGRTRAIMYDPNDGTNKRVFAGGVSGGLWVNDDITNAASAWSLVNMPQNLSVSSITYDPNNSNIFYVGTGESWSSISLGNAVGGNGVWKSTDGGINWEQIFGGASGPLEFGTDAKVTVNSPGSIAGDYPAILAAFGGNLTSSVTGNLVLVDDGTTNTDDGCETLINAGAISGNIAVIRRGGCPFVDKVNNAQDAGAIAVIVVNNVAGNPFIMGGTDAGITIPGIMVSRNDGNTIIAELVAGVNATMQLSGSTLTGITNTPGIFDINDIKVRDIGSGNSEIYVAVASSGFNNSDPASWFGLEDFGLYKSSDDGVNWNKLVLETGRSGALMPNDIEIASDNKIWVSTTNSPFGDGGRVFSSSDGTTFTIKKTIANATRTQIAISGTNPGTIYALARLSSGAPLELLKTTDGFANDTSLTQPTPVDTGQPADDFTRSQSWYNLLLEIDPTNDAKVYVGGIDLYSTSDSGSNWSQISKWSNNNALGSLSVSLVHADHHALTFNPSDSNLGIFGNDGGVYYSTSLSGASSNTSAIMKRNKNYNTVQFYKGAIGQQVNNEKLLAGAQDNANQLINNASAGIGGSFDIANGGDGAYVFIDKDNEYMISSFVYNVYRYHNYTSGNQIYTISGDQSNGAFINPAALDSDNNKLYADGTTGVPAFQIFRYNLGATSATRTVLTDPLLTSSPTAFKPSAFTTTTLFVGTIDGKLLKLTNANTSPVWTEITGSDDFVGSISCIELGETESDIYVTFYNYGVVNVFFSDDGGTSWSAKEGNLPDFPVRAILSNPLNREEVIIGTELGVWATTDFSSTNPTWYQSQDGMKDVQVTSFDLRTVDNTVLASTHGRGMFTGKFDATASGLSVEDFAQNNLIKIYPTVSNGELTISPTSEVRAGALAIFDINGREVHITDLDFATGANQHLSLNLASGVYVVKFTANGVQSTQKIVIE